MRVIDAGGHGARSRFLHDFEFVESLAVNLAEDGKNNAPSLDTSGVAG